MNEKFGDRKRVEDYLEAIYNIQSGERRLVRTTDLAKFLDVKPSTVTEMLLKLKDLGYIEYTPYRGAILTKKGTKVAEKIKKYHEIFEIFFKEYLGVSDDEAKKLSCEIEHYVSEDVAIKICALISGKCDVCETCFFKFERLSDVESGIYRVVASPKSLEKVGISPERTIEVVDKFTVKVNGEELRISEKYASLILLERIKS